MSTFPDDPSLQPLRIDRKPFRSVDTGALYHWQAARPPVWRRLWPGDALTVEVLERMSRLLRHHCGWRSDAFVPDDRISIVFFNWEISDYDIDETIMEIEDLLGVEFPISADVFRGTTLGEIVQRIADNPPDFAAIDREMFQPFALPADYHRTGLIHRLGRRLSRRGRARALHDRQACRTQKWRDYWPADGRTQRARALASRILVDRVGWFDEAFIPGDRLDALLLAEGGRPGTLAAVDEFVHLFPGRIADPGALPASTITFGEFIEALI